VGFPRSKSTDKKGPQKKKRNVRSTQPEKEIQWEGHKLKGIRRYKRIGPNYPIQPHPEASPGPHERTMVFEEFKILSKK